MAILWRISNFEDLSGIGGLMAEGRWHFKGNLIVYLAQNPALALLEVMAGLEIDVEDLPENFKLLKVEVPDEDLDNSSILELLKLPENPENLLSRNLENHDSRTQGTEWLNEKKTLLAKAPSAILPESYNYLYNPRHSNATKAKIIEVISFPFDHRLVT